MTGIPQCLHARSSSLLIVGAFLLAASLPASADLKVIYKVTQATPGTSSSTVLLVKGNRTRKETNADGVRTITVTRYDINRTFVLRDQDKTYSILPIESKNDELARKTQAMAVWGDEVLTPNERERRKRHGRVVFVYQLEDTGQRRTFFGQEARHVRVESYVIVSPEACQHADETKKVTDAWVIDWPVEMARVKEGFNDLEPRPGTPEVGCKDVVETAVTGKAKLGFVVLSDSKSIRNRVTVEGSESHFEVVQLSNLAVDAGLFEVPPDYNENQEGKDIPGSAVRNLLSDDRKYALPIKIGIGPIVSGVQRQLKLNDLRLRLLNQFKELEVTATDLNDNSLESSLVKARQLQLDFVIAARVRQADVPDDAQDYRPPFGNGTLEYQLYDVQSGKLLRKGNGISQGTMADAAADTAYRAFNDIAQTRSALQPAPVIQISVFPAESNLPIDKNALREQLIAELAKQEYGRGVRVLRIANKDDATQGAAYDHTWLLSTTWKADNKVSALQFSLMKLASSPPSTPDIAASGNTFNGSIAANDLTEAVHQASDKIAAEIRKEIDGH